MYFLYIVKLKIEEEEKNWEVISKEKIESLQRKSMIYLYSIHHTMFVWESKF